MKIWSVWYSCHEDSGSFGYFASEEQANEVLGRVQHMVGCMTKHGDYVQCVGIAEHTVGEADLSLLDGWLADTPVER